MNTSSGHLSRRLRRGYTLLELSLGISVGLMVGAMSLALLNQQTAFLRIFRAQNFLTSEAPVISNYVARVVGRAEGYRLHCSLNDATAGLNPVFDNASVLVLRFKQPDGVFREAILAYHDPGSGQGLYYDLVALDGSIGGSRWAVSKAVRDVNFAIEGGVLRVRLTGPNAEEITYSGTPQL